MLADDGKRKVRGLYSKSVSHFFVGIPSLPKMSYQEEISNQSNVFYDSSLYCSRQL